MLITINTDASFSYSWKRGGYAYWLVCNLGKIQRSGVLRSALRDPTHAEMQCIVNAFHEVSKNQLILQSLEKIVVNTDSMNSIHVFTNDREKMLRYKLINKEYGAVKKKYRELIESSFKDVEIVFTHVKAHQSTDTARSYVNDWLDKAAREALITFKEKEKAKRNAAKTKPHDNNNNSTALYKPNRRPVCAVSKSTRK